LVKLTNTIENAEGISCAFKGLEYHILSMAAAYRNEPLFDLKENEKISIFRVAAYHKVG
jgi:hypothetical protein